MHDWAAHQAIKVTGSWEKPGNRSRDERPTVKFYKWRLRARNIPEYIHFSTFTWTSSTISTSLSLSWDVSESYEEITSVISNGVRATNFVSFWPFLTCFTQISQILTLADWLIAVGYKNKTSITFNDLAKWLIIILSKWSNSKTVKIILRVCDSSLFKWSEANSLSYEHYFDVVLNTN
jgi:hypothetical protein